MANQKIIDAAQNQEIDQLISAAVQLISSGATTGDLKPRDETGDTTLFGEYQIDNNDKYNRYAQLSTISPHTFIPLAKLGLSIVSGFRLDSMEGTSEDLIKAFKTWSDAIHLREKMENMARLTVRDGTSIAYLPHENREDSTDQWISEIQILPMQFTTLLPEGIEPGEKAKNLMKGEIVKAILLESSGKKGGLTVFERGEFALFRQFHEGTFTKDIMGRETYGIYGISLIEPLIRTIKNYTDLTEGFSGNMRRYGAGRLHINLPLVEKLRASKQYDKAKKLLEDTISAMQKLGPNEDMVTGGAEVNVIPGTHAPQVREMKQSYEKDIHVGLLQSGVSMGDTQGSTHASSYMAEEDRYIILESIQENVRATVQRDIINKQLELLNLPKDSIEVKTDKLDVPYVDYNTLTDARINGDITEKEYRQALGFPEDKPVE